MKNNLNSPIHIVAEKLHIREFQQTKEPVSREVSLTLVLSRFL